MPASDILRRAAELVAAGWSEINGPRNALGETVPLFGGTTGDTARAGVNRDIAAHTLYSAIVLAAHELPGTNLAPIWQALNDEILRRYPHRPGGNTNYLHPVVGFNVAEGRTAEDVQALLNHVADQLDPSKPKAATPLPPVTL
jgi:hypothetical protein